MKICIYGAASSLIDQKFIAEGETLGRNIAIHGHSLVFGGGKSGMMGALARGVYEKNGKILGIAPRFFEEHNPEVAFENCTEFIHTESMSERKKLLSEHADGFVILPGGIGTFDEFFEILTLKQLGRHNKPIVIFNIDEYYDNMLTMINDSINKQFIPNDCKELFYVASSSGEVLEYLENYGSTEVDLSKVKIR